MYRGNILFKCTSCGHKFIAPDMEFCASAFSMPQRCPKCNSIRTRPARFLDGYLYSLKYQTIWKQLERTSSDSSHHR